MISTLNMIRLKEQLKAAKEAGMVQSQAVPKPNKPDVTEQTEAQTELDYDVLASFLQIEVNHEVSPLRLRTLLSRRLSELRTSGELNTLPDLVRDMLESAHIGPIKTTAHQRPNFELVDGKLVISGVEFGKLLEKRGVQCMLHHCQWNLIGGRLTLFDGFVGFFSLEQLKAVWEGVACEFPS